MLNEHRRLPAKWAVLFLTLGTALFFTSCPFFPTKAYYYLGKHRLDDIRGSISWAEEDSSGNIYFAEEGGGFIRKWNETSGMDEDYLSFDGEIKQAEFDKETLALYVLAGTILWDVDIVGRTKTEIINIADNGCMGFCTTANYVIIGSQWSGYHAIRKSDYTIIDTINPTIEAEEYLYTGENGIVLLAAADTGWLDTVLAVAHFDDTNGTFTGLNEYTIVDPEATVTVENIRSLMLRLQDVTGYLTFGGAIVRDDEQLSHDGNLSFDNFSNTFSEPRLEDACFFNNSLVTIESNYEETHLALRSAAAPYDETVLPVDLDIRFEKIFPFEDSLYVIGRAEGSERGIFKFDATLWD